MKSPKVRKAGKMKKSKPKKKLPENKRKLAAGRWNFLRRLP